MLYIDTDYRYKICFNSDIFIKYVVIQVLENKKKFRLIIKNTAGT